MRLTTTEALSAEPPRWVEPYWVVAVSRTTSTQWTCSFAGSARTARAAVAVVLVERRKVCVWGTDGTQHDPDSFCAKIPGLRETVAGLRASLVAP